MRRVDVVTLFPEMIQQAVSYSILGRACESGLLDIRAVYLRDYTHDRHRTVDDSPYGGGAGMVMKVGPVAEAVEAIRAERGGAVQVILMSPQGQPLTQAVVQELAALQEGFVVLCGHYEGVDERIREHFADREISIGDYVLTGGELPALVLIDAVARQVPGVLGKMESAENESFAEGLLEHPHYTRPEEFGSWRVPEMLLSGHHAQIAEWRRRESLRRTLLRRPDLLLEAALNAADVEALEEMGAGAGLMRRLRSRLRRRETATRKTAKPAKTPKPERKA